MVTKEIDKLRNTIQTLTRATNPLGKLLDYFQVIYQFIIFYYATYITHIVFIGGCRDYAKRIIRMEKSISTSK